MSQLVIEAKNSKEFELKISTSEYDQIPRNKMTPQNASKFAIFLEYKNLHK